MCIPLGGIADRMGNMGDVFHTFFGIAGLSLLQAVKQLKPVDPVYSLTVDVVKANGFPGSFYPDKVVEQKSILCSIPSTFV